MMDLTRTKIVDKCVDCKKIDGEYCMACINPNAMWKAIGHCPLYTEIVREIKKEQKINPLKASKNKAKGKGVK